MVRKIIILLSLCCVVLCAFVGFLSKDAIDDSQLRLGPAVPISCGEILDERPNETSHLLVDGFVPGKHLATLDANGDGQWERLCVPFFAPRKQETHNYRAVLVCFKNVATREAFKELIATEEVDTNYWPMRQKLDVPLHSQLAQKYKNLDFANSPILHCGFEASNPVLGETSLKLSAGIACIAVFAAVIAFLAGLFVRKPRDSAAEMAPPESPTNRAGLPGGGGSVLDRVTSMREQHTV